MGLRGELLVVDDEPAMCDFVENMLRTDGYAVTCRARAEDALALMNAKPFDVLLTDMKLHGMDGLELCEKVHAEKPQVPVLLFTGHGNMNAAIAAMRAGATDFIPKSNDPDEFHRALRLAVGRALEHRLLGEEVVRLKRKVSKLSAPHPLVGFSPAMVAVQELVDRIAGSNAPVLITGEPGTGKEFVARTLHARSACAGGPLVTLDAAALPEELFESELLGATNGARAQHPGRLAEARGGTLLVNDVDRLSAASRASLAEAIRSEARSYAGGNPSGCRLIATSTRTANDDTSEPLFGTNASGEPGFAKIHVPALREREEDVLCLTRHFVDHLRESLDKEIARVDDEVAERFLDYPWPGNVRELKKTLAGAFETANGSEITLSDLPKRIASSNGSRAATALGSLEDVERAHIARVLAALGGNKRAAARTLKVDRSTLYRKLARYKLGRPE